MRAAYLGRMTASHILVSSGSDFESAVGYSRAVRIGPHVAVAGTTGAGPAGDIAAQTRDALHRIELALQQAGAALTDVVRLVEIEADAYVESPSGGKVPSRNGR